MPLSRADSTMCKNLTILRNGKFAAHEAIREFARLDCERADIAGELLIVG